MNLPFLNRKRYLLLDPQNLEKANEGVVLKYLKFDKTKHLLWLGVLTTLTSPFWVASLNPNNPYLVGFGGVLVGFLLGLCLFILGVAALVGLEKVSLWWRGLSPQAPYHYTFSNKEKIAVLKALERNKNALPSILFNQIIKTITDEAPSDRWWWQLKMVVKAKSDEAQTVGAIQKELLHKKIKKMDEQSLDYPKDVKLELSVDKKIG
jgi:hypothetical protein